MPASELFMHILALVRLAKSTSLNAMHVSPNQLAAALALVKLESTNTEQKQRWLSDARADYEASLNPPKQNSPVDMSQIMAWLQQHADEDVIITNGAEICALAK